MGVIRANPRTVQNADNVVGFALEDFVVDYLVESPDPSDDDQSLVELPVNTPTSPRRKVKSNQIHGRVGYAGLTGDFSLEGAALKGGRKTKHMGSRKLRRLQHACELLAIAEGDICEDLSDTLPDSFSAFSQLFNDDKNMKLWNDFCDRSEDEQLHILDGSQLNASSSGVVLGGGLRGGVRRPVTSNQSDRRAGHPAFSGDECYNRIHSRLRQILAQKRLPLSKMDHYESELNEFFSTDSEGVWLQSLDNGFDRLVLHTVAQYLSLASKSFDCGDRRETQVENLKAYFIPPHQTLVSYIEEKRKVAT